MSRVTVVGSANLDTFHRVAALPAPGETVRGTGLSTAVGGKGANQAIAAARTGVEVRLVAAVGRDAEGDRIVQVLRRSGVATDGVVRIEEPTGRATIVVDDAGDNTIVLTAGANDSIPIPAALRDAGVLVVQGEIPPEATRAAIAAAGPGARIVVNLAPFLDLGGAERVADPLVLNEIEAAQLLGIPAFDPAAPDAVDAVRGRALSVVVTLGAAGALVADPTGVTRVPAPVPARVVDTTGAGDAFVGVLAAALASGSDLVEAARVAVRAASASVEALGAGESYPAFTLDG